MRPRLIPAVLVLAIAPVAVAEPLPALTVTRGAGAGDCPDAVTLAADIERMNARPSVDPIAKEGARTRLFVEISHGPEGYEATIHALGEKSGERHLADLGPSCENLAEALALTVALVVEDHHRASIEVAPRDEVGTPIVPPSAAPKRPPIVIDLGASLGIQAGVLPRVGLGVTARIRVQLTGALDAEAGGLVAPSQTVDDATRRGKVTFEFASGFIGICGKLAGERDSFEVSLCAEPWIGRLRATGADFERNAGPQDHIWLAGGLALGASGPLVGQLRYAARASGVVSSDHRFFATIDGREEVIFDSPPAALLAFAGLLARVE